MSIVTYTRRYAGFLASEANAYRSRERVTIDGASAPGTPAATILGKLTATGHYVPYNAAGADGSQTISGVLLETAVGTVDRTIIARDAEVAGVNLIYPAGANDAAKATANAALKTLGIIVR